MLSVAASLAALIAAGVLAWRPVAQPVAPAQSGPVMPACAQRWEQANSQRVLGPRETIGVSAGDVDGDGHPDVVYANQLDETLSIYWGDGAPRLGTPQELRVGRVSGAVGLGHADQDGRLDLFVADADTSKLTAWLQREARHFVEGPRSEQPALMSEEPVQLVDWDRDGIDDLLLNDGAGAVVRRGVGQGVYASAGERVANGVAWAERANGSTHIWSRRSDGLTRWSRGAATSTHNRDVDTPVAIARILPWGGGALAVTGEGRLLDLSADPACDLRTTPTKLVGAAADLDHDGMPELFGYITCSGCTSNHILERWTAR